MNEYDRHIYFSDIFQILKPRLQQWTMFEVLQFLVVIRSPFSDMVRKHQVSGNLLVNLPKLEKLFVSELNTNNILPYLKMLMIVEEIRGSNPFPEHCCAKDDVLANRPRPRSMVIDERLMRAIQAAMERISDKPFIQWSSQQVVELLQAMNFNRFVKTVQQCRLDGFILLCIGSDWESLCRLKKYMPAQQIQEINFVARVMLASNYFVRYYKEEEEVVPALIKQAEVKLEVKSNQKDQQPTEDQSLKMLQKSAEEMSEDNDFFLAYGEMGSSMVKQSQPSEDSSKLGRIHSQEEPPVIGKNNGHFFMSQDSLGERKGLISHSMGHAASSARESRANSNGSEEFRQSGKHLHHQQGGDIEYPELPPIQQDPAGSQEQRSKFAQSYYPGQSRRESHLAESCAPDRLAQSYIPDKMAESFIPESVMAESRFDNESVTQSQSNSTFGNTQLGQTLFMSSMEQPNRLNELRSVTMSLPFDLLSFESLHLISLVEVNEKSHEQQSSDDLYTKTFSIRGVRFGRDKQNDYSYPDELSISSKHALIVFRDEAFHLQDLGSKTGTFKKLTGRTEMYQGMKLQLSHVIEFVVDKISSKEDQGLIMLVFLKPDTMPRYQARIKNGVKLTMGRWDQCSIPIDGKKLSISMKHAEILYENGKFFFMDTSQNGSWVRLSQKGAKSEPMKLLPNDRFRISSKKVFLVSDIKFPGRLC